MKKGNKEEVENQKKKFKLVVDYLVDSYYLNPQKEFTIDEISKKLKIKNNLIIEKFIFSLKKDKYIILNKKTNEFALKYKGFLYLESIQKNNTNYENNFVALVISIGAFFISAYSSIVNSSIANSEENQMVYMIIFIFAMVGIVYYSIKKIINKKYY